MGHTAEIALTQMLYDGFLTSSEVKRFKQAQVVRYFELLGEVEQKSLDTALAYMDVQLFRELLRLAEENLITHVDVFKQIEESKRKEIHSLNFRLGKNVIFNSELIRPELMKLKFYLWNIFHTQNYNIDFYIPKDGNATLNAQSSLNLDLIAFLGFIFQNKLLIRIDIFNEFEKQLFKRENRGPFSLPMDLSNLLGIKKDKLIEILNDRSYLVQEI